MCERGEEVLIDRIALAVNARLLIHLRLKAAPLLLRVGELSEPVRELNSATIELEALRESRVIGRGSRERGFHSRIAIEDRRLLEPKPRLDALDEHPAENIRPGIVRRDF